MKLKTLSIILIATLLCSCGKSGSSSAEGENKSQEPTTAKVVVDNASFPDGLSGICRINRDVTYDVEVKKEDGDLFNYTMDIAIYTKQPVEVVNINDLDVQAALLDEDGNQLGIFDLSSDSKEKLAYALKSNGKAMLTFKHNGKEALPLSKAKYVEICVAKTGDLMNLSQSSRDDEKYKEGGDEFNPNAAAPTAPAMGEYDYEGDI